MAEPPSPQELDEVNSLKNPALHGVSLATDSEALTSGFYLFPVEFKEWFPLLQFQLSNHNAQPGPAIGTRRAS